VARITQTIKTYVLAFLASFTNPSIYSGISFALSSSSMKPRPDLPHWQSSHRVHCLRPRPISACSKWGNDQVSSPTDIRLLPMSRRADSIMQRAHLPHHKSRDADGVQTFCAEFCRHIRDALPVSDSGSPSLQHI
jgi:hypothetical protein